MSRPQLKSKNDSLFLGKVGIKPKNYNAGLTLTELLIVVVILGILLLLVLMSWQIQTAKARDAKRKDDLNRLRIAFEDYYNDHNCYPPEEWLDQCGSKVLYPYLQAIPCDPITNEPYEYVYDPTCASFQLYTLLDNDKDLDIFKLGCGSGCGPSGAYNYGIASGTTLTTGGTSGDSGDSGGDSGDSGGDSGATPTPPGGNYACDPYGECNLYEDPEAAGCPITFSNPVTCQNACDQSSQNWCDQ